MTPSTSQSETPPASSRKDITLATFKTIPGALLALGAELKASLCLLQDGQALLENPPGPLDDPAVLREYLACMETLRADAGELRAIACDMHPQYAATRIAHRQGERILDVQHHHAHIAAVMAEHRLEGPVVGIACDGTGYGTDGSIWGGEVLVCHRGQMQRVGHLRSMPLPGGDAAAVETWRPAAGWLAECFGGDWPAPAERRFEGVDTEALRLVQSRLAADSSRPVRTTSLGRLFDAVAFVLGICERNDTEAQAPQALQHTAEQSHTASPIRGNLRQKAGLWEIDTEGILRGLLDGMDRGEDVGALARGFHQAIADLLADCATRAAKAAHTRLVALSGGCMLNALLRDQLVQQLQRHNLDVRQHRLTSPGDGCIALGQACVAAWTLQDKHGE